MNSFKVSDLTTSPIKERFNHLPIKSRWRRSSSAQLHNGFLAPASACFPRYDSLSFFFSVLTDLRFESASFPILPRAKIPISIPMLGRLSEANFLTDKEQFSTLLSLWDFSLPSHFSYQHSALANFSTIASLNRPGYLSHSSSYKPNQLIRSFLSSALLPEHSSYRT